MRRFAQLILTATAMFVIALSPGAAAKRSITESDLLKFVWVADPQISPDGSRVAFVRVTVDEKGDQYKTALWIARADGSEPPRPLTSGTRDLSPRWSEGGRYVAFVRSEEKDGKPQPSQIYVMSMGGGEARAVTDIPRGASSPAWSPDGKSIAFASTARAADLEKDPKAADRESDVKVVTQAVYRANGVPGSGRVDPDRPSEIWVTTVDTSAGTIAKPKPLTTGPFSAGNHQWSPDGTEIYFIADRRKEPYYLPRDSDLYAVSVRGGEPRRAASIEGSIGDYAFSPDRKRLAFVGTLHGEPERSYSQSDLWVMDLGGTPRNLTQSYDFDIDGGVGGDQRAPRGQSPSGPVWSKDGGSIMIGAGIQGNSNIVKVDVSSGQVENLTNGNQDVMAFTADDTAQRLAAVRSMPTVIGDLYVLDLARRAPLQITRFNEALLGDVALPEPEEFWCTSFDGRKIQGWILKPADFDGSKKYPLILEIHGGPHSAYGNTFTHEFLWMAAKGYVVLYTNPRGSSNYGQEFGNIIQFRYPGDDYKDLMAGVDEVIKRGYVDEQRMGVTGGSGGGLLTNWVVTQTSRFKAAVSQRDISDWANFWYTADFTLFTPTWFRKAPFEDPADYAARSPITHVTNIHTPLMFILGDEDWRTPPSAGGEDLFRALKYLKRPTVMVRFPGENHELSRSGKPSHRIERLKHIVGWFDQWLLGERNPAYGQQ